MTRTELNEQMANGGKTGLLITAETRMELLQAQVEELGRQLAVTSAAHAAKMNEAQKLRAQVQQLEHNAKYWQQAAEYRAERMEELDNENRLLTAALETAWAALGHIASSQDFARELEKLKR